MKFLREKPSFALENQFGPGCVIGVDEVGFGAWAGPVVVAACVLDPEKIPQEVLGQIDDSKKILTKRRAALFESLLSLEGCGLIWALGQSSPQEIDALNIKGATHKAIQTAVNSLIQRNAAMKFSGILMDGTHAPTLPIPTKCVVGGDSKSLSIAAASILAKVSRDRMMTELSAVYPEYGWAQNVGYGTARHQEALSRLGVTPHHRLSYKPVQKCS